MADKYPEGKINQDDERSWDGRLRYTSGEGLCPEGKQFNGSALFRPERAILQRRYGRTLMSGTANCTLQAVAWTKGRTLSDSVSRSFHDFCIHSQPLVDVSRQCVAAYRLLLGTQSKGSVMPSLSYSESLRAIGHSLEVLGISTFALEKQDANYIVRATGSTTIKKTVLKRIAARLKQSRKPDKQSSGPLSYTATDISRLAGEQQSQHRKANVMPDAHKLAQSLRMIGYYLDRKEASAFNICVSSQLLIVSYETSGGHRQQESFTMENLYDLAVHMYLRRWKRAV